MFTMDLSLESLQPIALEQTQATGNWLLSAVNYVALTIAPGAAMTIVMGGDERNEKD